MEVLYSLVALCALLVLAQLSPGPDVFFVFRTALAQGFRAGAAVGCGISLGFLIQATLACTVGAWVMQQPWSVWLLWLASAWLLYLSWKILPKKWGAEVEIRSRGDDRETCGKLLLQGFLCNILNPKCMLFILALSAGALHDYAALTWFAPVLVLAMTLSGLCGWLVWSALLQWAPVQQVYRKYTYVVDMIFSVLLAVFAVLLLL